jgi:outer membrane protein insertion porin family
MRLMLFLVLLCAPLLSLGEQSAATKKDPPPGVIHSVTVTGNKRYGAEAIAKESGLIKGERVTPAVIEQARQKLQSTELFNSVSDSFKWLPGAPYQYDVTFSVTEIDQVFPLRFERIKQPVEQLRGCIETHVPLYADEIPATEGVLQRYTRAVQECAGVDGTKTKIKGRVSNEDPKEMAIVFAPDTPPPTISQVEVSGNQAVDTGTLLRAVNQVAIGVPLDDVRLKQILDGSLKQVYASKGYVGVTFPKVEAVPAKTNEGVILRVQIQEGPVYDFGAIRFRGSGMDPEQVKSNISFRPGQAYNARQVDDFRIWMAHSLRQSGHLDASVTFDTDLDNSKRVVNVIYNVAPGPVYTFASLDVQGLDVSSAPAVEQLWGEKQGKPFNPDYPDFFLKRIDERKMFEHLADTSSDYTADPASHTVIVHLYFKGGKTKEERAKEEQQKRDGRTTDGTWSPYFLPGR